MSTSHGRIISEDIDRVAPVNTETIQFPHEMTRKKPYHHGNLHEALLDASVRLIAEVGPQGFTLREVARRAGVSHNAPYRHFHDKDDLLAAVATQGYGELTAAMVESAARHTDARNRLKYAGLAYISFAIRRPEHFTVMFEAPVPQKTRPDATLAAERTFSVLIDLVRDWRQSDQSAPDINPDPLPFALLAWTMVHGVAKLAITGRLPYRSKAKILEFAAFVIDESLPAWPGSPPASSPTHDTPMKVR